MIEPGTLFVVATPIGNMEDITLRAQRILKEADVLACEDTRQTAKIYNYYEIPKPEIRVPYHEHNEKKMEERLLELLLEGKSVALCSDAGYPGISDPGYRIIARASEEGIPVEVIPGASAVPIALLMSGLPTSSYVFKGFAPKKSGQRQRFCREDGDRGHTMVIYESPYRVVKFLKDAYEALGDRMGAVCIELTKKFQRVHRGYLADLIEEFKDKTVKGEVVIVIAGNNPKFTREAGADGESEGDE